MTCNTTVEKTSNLNSFGACDAFSCELAVCMGNRPRVSTNFTGFLPAELSSKWTSSGELVGGTWQGCRSLLRHPWVSYYCRWASRVCVLLSTLSCRLAWIVRDVSHGAAARKCLGKIKGDHSNLLHPVAMQIYIAHDFKVQETDVSSTNCCIFKIWV